MSRRLRGRKRFAILLVFTSLASCSVSDSCDLPQVLDYPGVQLVLPFASSWREKQLKVPRKFLFFNTSIPKFFQSACKVFLFLPCLLSTKPHRTETLCFHEKTHHPLSGLCPRLPISLFTFASTGPDGSANGL